jgi:alpha-tubulin suppressor-like RCC1 family protein
LGIGGATRDHPPYIPVPFAVTHSRELKPVDVDDIQCGNQFTVVLKKSGEVRASRPNKIISFKCLFRLNFVAR